LLASDCFEAIVFVIVSMWGMLHHKAEVLILANIMQEHREAARIASLRRKLSWVAAAVIVTVWTAVQLICAPLIFRHK
jgi:hypothetical protein